MTRAKFIDRVLSLKNRREGFIADTDLTRLNEFCMERLSDATFYGKLLFADKVTFDTSLETSSGVYDIQGAAFAEKMVSVTDVYVGGEVLKDYQSRTGPVALTDITEAEPGYLTSTGTPVRWIQLPPKQIRLTPAPTEEIENSWVSGFYCHPILADDDDLIQVTTGDEEWCAKYVCGRLLESAKDKECREFAQSLLSESMAYLQTRKLEADRMLHETLVRGRKREMRSRRRILF